jgi:hypothetical protein
MKGQMPSIPSWQTRYYTTTHTHHTHIVSTTTPRCGDDDGEVSLVKQTDLTRVTRLCVTPTTHTHVKSTAREEQKRASSVEVMRRSTAVSE